MNDIEKLNELISKSNRIAFFGGAGVSTESGVPDFRSVDGLYNQKYDYPPEQILSHTFFIRNTSEFFKFYFDKMIFNDAKPNSAHYKLAEMESLNKMTGLVTQNIDGFHQQAGSKRVFELHGSVKRNYCMRCGKFYSLEELKKDDAGIPRCSSCGGIVKPDVVLYEESLDGETIEGAVKAIQSADLLIVGGTSLNVYPAAGLVHYFKGDNIALINLEQTPFDGTANLVIREKIGLVFSEIKL